MVRLHRALPTIALLLAGTIGGGGCGTDATGTDACRKIERARCQKAVVTCPELGLHGSVGVEECVQYTRDRCLHGLGVADPGPSIVDACVSAIEQATTCDIVVAPEKAPACAFLTPTPVPVDAGSDVSPEAASDPDATIDGG